MSRHVLSKSTFTYGRQCLKRLYLHKNHKKLNIKKDELTLAQKARFGAGSQVGLLAQTYFPHGVDCSPASNFDYSDSLMATFRAMGEGGNDVIYEAAFQAEGVLAALDILVLMGDGWHGYEVKSTSDVEDQHIVDAALQHWVIKRAGVNIVSMSIMHLNPEYVLREDGLDVKMLFCCIDITRDVVAMESEITAQIEEQKSCLDIEEVPEVSIGPHCSKPYDCDFKGHCWKQAGVPEYSVLNLSRGGKKSWKLFHSGVRHVADVDPESVKLSPMQRMQVDAEKSNRVHVNAPELAFFLRQIVYPVYYFDFETIAPAVPLFPRSRCYQQIPFQYSLHILQEEITSEIPTDTEILQHREFLGDGSTADPRIPLLEQLIADLGEYGSIVVYSKSFEDTRLQEMARDFPEYAERIALIRSRLVDLAVPFQEKHYYDPAMKGKYSIKQVLPAVCPDCQNSYKELDIRDGFTASSVYLNMVTGNFEGDRDKGRIDLLKYCKLDTFAMVKIHDKLSSITRSTLEIDMGELISRVEPLNLSEEFKVFNEK